MHKMIDRTAVHRPPEGGAHTLRVSVALRALARFTFPGLEPESGYATGYHRTAVGLGCFRPLELAALRQLVTSGHAMRIGRAGYCITRRGRELARIAYGEDALAREREMDDGTGRRTLVEGKAER